MKRLIGIFVTVLVICGVIAGVALLTACESCSDPTCNDGYGKRPITIEMYDEDELYEATEIESRSAAFRLPTPEKEGYTFLGWSNLRGSTYIKYSGGDCITYKDIYNASKIDAEGRYTFSLFAVWEKDADVSIEYTLTFDPAGGTMTAMEQTVAEGNSITLPRATRAGYTLTGWAVGDQLVGAPEERYTPDGDATLTAQWDLDVYTVTYDVGKGTLTGDVSVQVPPGKSTTLPGATPEYGYRFGGWSDGETIYLAGGQYTPTGDITLTAQWDLDVYTVTYRVGKGTLTGNAPVQVTAGESITLPGATPEYGYLFDGWSHGSKIYPAGSLFTPTGDITFTAAYTWLSRYEVSFGVAEDLGRAYPAIVVPSTQTNLLKSATITLPTLSEVSGVGYGWYNGDTQVGRPGETYEVTETVHLVAKPDAPILPTLYTVDFDLGEVGLEFGNGVIAIPGDMTQLEEGSHILLPVLSAYGEMLPTDMYGWYLGDTYVGAGGDSYIPTANVTLTAKFIALIPR